MADCQQATGISQNNNIIQCIFIHMKMQIHSIILNENSMILNKTHLRSTIILSLNTTY